MRRPALILVLWLAVFGAVAGTAAAKGKARKAPAPVVTRISPLKAVVGQQLTLRGRHFRPGKGRNGVGFKADGKPIVFVKAGLSTRRLMRVTLPPRLESVLAGKPRRLRVRVLTSRFGRRYTSKRRSPTIAPRPGSVPVAPAAGAPTLPGGATGTGLPIAACNANSKSETADQDDDHLPDALEGRIATDPCDADTDGDGVEDGYEYRSAVDLNDDEYRQPNTVLPYPGKRPYPNPLFADDAGLDFDGDGFSIAEEYRLWLADTPAGQRSFADAAPRATPLSYSDGLQYSQSVYCPAGGPALCGAGDDNRRVPALRSADEPGYQAFTAWAAATGYEDVRVSVKNSPPPWYDHLNGRASFNIRDLDLSGTVDPDEAVPADFDQDGFASDDERDADGDGLSNLDESHGRMLPAYWAACYALEPAYPLPYAATSASDPDTDGDGVLDGADDEDHDDFPNLMELSRIRAARLDDRQDGKPCKPLTPLTVADANGNLPTNHPGAYGQVNPFNPCEPYRRSRTCRTVWPSGQEPAPFTGPDWWALQ